MGVKDTARRQYTKIVDQAAQQIGILEVPSEGWIAMLRRALGMSGAQVARRAGVTRAAIYQAERNEQEGAITIKQMEKIAQSMGCNFVYALVPDGQVEDVIRAQGQRKARSIIGRAGAHMALESQSLSKEETKKKIERLAEELVRDMPSDFWEEI